MTRLALAGALVLASCRSAPEPASLTSAPAGDATATRERMRGHDAHGAAIRDAVARGDLDTARRESRVLAELRPQGDLAPAWRKPLEAMNAAAARLAEATDIGAASHALGALARTCGDCHATLGGPAATIGEAPEAEDGGVTLRMKRHQWAEARLWDGLVVPSDRAWRAGAHALADAPLVPAAAPAADVLAQSVHALGRKAIVVGAPVDRGAVYGELMATCASCHALVR